MKKTIIIIIGMALMSTGVYAQTDTTYQDQREFQDTDKTREYGDDQYGEDRNNEGLFGDDQQSDDQYGEDQYGEDQNFEKNRSNDDTYNDSERSYDENPAREDNPAWQEDSVGQYGNEQNSYGSDEAGQYGQEYGSDTTDNSGYGDRYQDNRSYGADTTGTGSEYGNRDYREKGTYGTDTTDRSDQYGQNQGLSGYGNDLTDDAKDFIKKAAESSMLEMQLAQIAMQKEDVSNELLRYGKNLVEDHAEVNRKLKKIADDFQVEIPEIMTPGNDVNNEHQNLINELRDMDRDQFNETFINRMIEEHQALIDDFEQARDNVDNEELSSWIDNTLPSLKDHLNIAQELQSKIENDELQEDDGLFEDNDQN